jgi:hypothetical protein
MMFQYNISVLIYRINNETGVFLLHIGLPNYAFSHVLVNWIPLPLLLETHRKVSTMPGIPLPLTCSKNSLPIQTSSTGLALLIRLKSSCQNEYISLVCVCVCVGGGAVTKIQFSFSSLTILKLLIKLSVFYSDGQWTRGSCASLWAQKERRTASGSSCTKQPPEDCWSV